MDCSNRRLCRYTTQPQQQQYICGSPPNYQYQATRECLWTRTVSMRNASGHFPTSLVTMRVYENEETYSSLVLHHIFCHLNSVLQKEHYPSRSFSCRSRDYIIHSESFSHCSLHGSQLQPAVRDGVPVHALLSAIRLRIIVCERMLQLGGLRMISRWLVGRFQLVLP